MASNSKAETPLPEAVVEGIGRFVEAACCRSESDDSRSGDWRLWRFMPSYAKLAPGGYAMSEYPRLHASALPYLACFNANGYSS